MEKLVAGEEALEERRSLAVENVDEDELPACEDDLEWLEARVSTWMYEVCFELGDVPLMNTGSWAGFWPNVD